MLLYSIQELEAISENGYTKTISLNTVAYIILLLPFTSQSKLISKTLPTYTSLKALNF